MNGIWRRVIICVLVAMPFCTAPAHAITGGTTVHGRDGLRRSVVRIESAIGEVCSGVLVAPDIVLTAAHCVAVVTSYRAFLIDGDLKPRRIAISAILKHPSFVAGTTPHDQPGADLALVRLERAVSGNITTDMIPRNHAIAPDTELKIAGYGISSYWNRQSVRTLRIAPVVVLATDQPPNNLIVAADRRTRARIPGASACLGDSGGPALVETVEGLALGGIISWASAPERAKHMTPCGGFTEITPIAPHLGWIARGVEQLKR